MSTLLARRNFAQDAVAELRRLLASLAAHIVRADSRADESSTSFSWPRGL